ncbi:hypothetical protein HAHE_36200 [Haloferula helveola]|uniref:SLA1 homology domain-containing protein n=1 Tax=Haloferula helveola TaxID=490095 RepID=A0ABM7RHL0_9BACT|nr:hypothetical protein HAHE_36200 [Haloferula helveola]
MQRIILSALVVLWPLSVAHGREFTGKNGKKIEAEIISKTPDTVELKLDTGKTVTVPLTSLSEADQLYIRVWESPEDKAARLKAVELAEVLKAKGFIDCPIEKVEQGTVVTLDVDGKTIKMLIDHRNEQPLIQKAAIERLGLKMEKVEGGGNVLGTFTPAKLGNGSSSRPGMEFYVVNIDSLPEGIDGMIGGQVFVDTEVWVDFARKVLWMKGGS